MAFIAAAGPCLRASRPVAEEQGKQYYVVPLRPRAARAFVVGANSWLAANARWPGLAAERAIGDMEHFVHLSRRPGKPDRRPRRQLPACWPARFVLHARRFLCAARLQPAPTAGHGSEPAIELWAACSTANGLLQIATLARDCGLQVRGRAVRAADITVRLTDALSFAAAVDAVHRAVEDIVGPALCSRADGAAHWRVPATHAEAVVAALHAPDAQRLIRDQRVELPDLQRAARGPV